MQLYRDLRVLTARPSPEEEARAPHHLFGVADAGEAWSVGRWLRAAAPVLARLAAERRPAIVVGGTGLYFKALTHGLADIPEVSPAVRANSDALYLSLGEGGFRQELRVLDARSESAISAGDRQRLVRAHAVAMGTGRALSAWRDETRPTLAAGAWRGVVVEPPRAELYRRCDARFDAMLEQGALEEVRSLLARGLDPGLPAMKALGVPALAAHLRGELSSADATAAAKQATRNFAKRQSTWFRNQAPGWARVAGGSAAMVSGLFTD